METTKTLLLFTYFFQFMIFVTIFRSVIFVKESIPSNINIAYSKKLRKMDFWSLFALIIFIISITFSIIEIMNFKVVCNDMRDSQSLLVFVLVKIIIAFFLLYIFHFKSLAILCNAKDK